MRYVPFDEWNLMPSCLRSTDSDQCYFAQIVHKFYIVWAYHFNFVYIIEHFLISVKEVICFSHNFAAYAKFSKTIKLLWWIFIPLLNPNQYFACSIAFTFSLCSRTRVCALDRCNKWARADKIKGDGAVVYDFTYQYMMDVKLLAEEYGVHNVCEYSIHIKQVCGIIIKLFKRFRKLITRSFVFERVCLWTLVLWISS